MTQADADFQTWHTFHKNQLDQINLPEKLHRKLFQKLKFEDYDIGQWVKIIMDENNDSTTLICNKPLEKESDVFLVDHAWTFSFQDAV